MRKKDDSLRGLLLQKARKIVETYGAGALTMRTLAASAGVASGTVYNYFENKEEVLLLLTESYWQGALAELKSVLRPGKFTGQLQQVFEFLRERIGEEGGVLMGSLGGVRSAGRERMRGMQSAVEEELALRLEQDASIRPGTWTAEFTRERFSEFVFENMLCRIRGGESEIGFFLEAVGRILYGEQA